MRREIGIVLSVLAMTLMAGCGTVGSVTLSAAAKTPEREYSVSLGADFSGDEAPESQAEAEPGAAVDAEDVQADVQEDDAVLTITDEGDITEVQ